MASAFCPTSPAPNGGTLPSVVLIASCLFDPKSIFYQNARMVGRIASARRWLLWASGAFKPSETRSATVGGCASNATWARLCRLSDLWSRVLSGFAWQKPQTEGRTREPHSTASQIKGANDPSVAVETPNQHQLRRSVAERRPEDSGCSRI